MYGDFYYGHAFEAPINKCIEYDKQRKERGFDDTLAHYILPQLSVYSAKRVSILLMAIHPEGLDLFAKYYIYLWW